MPRDDAPSRMTPRLAPRDPDFAARIRESFAAQGALAALDARIVSLEAGLCAIRLPYGPAVTQQQGLFHGGVIATVADSAGGYAAMSLTPPGTQVVTVEYKINFLIPARGAALVATGRVLRSGRTLSVAEVDVVVEGAAETVAVAQQTIYAIAP